jgi:hypothetical protein
LTFNPAGNFVTTLYFVPGPFRRSTSFSVLYAPATDMVLAGFSSYLFVFIPLIIYVERNDAKFGVPKAYLRANKDR